MRTTDTVDAAASMTQADIKRNNAALALRAIRDHPGLTRAQLATKLRITKVGIARHVDDLITAGLITEEPVATGRRGRPGLQLALAAAASTGLGYDLRIDRRREVVYDLAGTVRGQRPIVAGRRPAFDAVVAEIADGVAEAREREPGRLAGVAVAVPGRFDPAWATIDRSFYGGTEPYPILAELRAAIGPGVQVTMLDIPAAAATALSGATGLDNLIHIQIGVAAGMASTADRGSAGLPVSRGIGHLPLELDGRPCECGRRGCADTRIGFDDLADRVRAVGVRLPDDPGADIRLAAADHRPACDTGQAEAIAAVTESAPVDCPRRRPGHPHPRAAGSDHRRLPAGPGPPLRGAVPPASRPTGRERGADLHRDFAGR